MKRGRVTTALPESALPSFLFSLLTCSEEECKAVLDLLLTDKEPLKSFDSIKSVSKTMTSQRLVIALVYYKK